MRQITGYCLWLVVLASKVRDVSEFQCLVTNFKDEGGNCDDSRMVVEAATAACPGEWAGGAASLNSRLQPRQQFAEDLVFAIKSPIALDTYCFLGLNCA